jgi:hypothetical protein
MSSTPSSPLLSSAHELIRTQNNCITKPEVGNQNFGCFFILPAIIKKNIALSAFSWVAHSFPFPSFCFVSISSLSSFLSLLLNILIYPRISAFSALIHITSTKLSISTRVKWLKLLLLLLLSSSSSSPYFIIVFYEKDGSMKPILKCINMNNLMPVPWKFIIYCISNDYIILQYFSDTVNTNMLMWGLVYWRHSATKIICNGYWKTVNCQITYYVIQKDKTCRFKLPITCRLSYEGFPFKSIISGRVTKCGFWIVINL